MAWNIAAGEQPARLQSTITYPNWASSINIEALAMHSTTLYVPNIAFQCSNSPTTKTSSRTYSAACPKSEQGYTNIQCIIESKKLNNHTWNGWVNLGGLDSQSHIHVGVSVKSSYSYSAIWAPNVVPVVATSILLQTQVAKLTSSWELPQITFQNITPCKPKTKMEHHLWCWGKSGTLQEREFGT